MRDLWNEGLGSGTEAIESEGFSMSTFTVLRMFSFVGRSWLLKDRGEI